MSENNQMYIDRQIEEIQRAIPVLEERVRVSKLFKEIYNNEAFQEVFMDMMLGSEMKAKAETLVLNPYMDEELEQETLIVLRSMRFLNMFIQNKVMDIELAPQELKMNEDLLAELVLQQEEDLY